MDSNLKLTRFTPEASKIFRIREGDIGRPIDDFTHQMEYPEFLADLHRVMETAQVCEREVKTWDHHWYLVRSLPYIDQPRNISGAVVTLFDITNLKDMQRLQGILDSLPEHIAVLDNLAASFRSTRPGENLPSAMVIVAWRTAGQAVITWRSAGFRTALTPKWCSRCCRGFTMC